MSGTGGLNPEVIHKIKGVLQILFPNARIYLYGSRAKGNFDVRSDIDLAIDAGKRISLAEARSVLEGLSIPQKFDLVDVHFISSDFKAEISSNWLEL